MVKVKILFIAFMFAFFYCCSQNNNNSCVSTTNLFSDGVCLEGIGLIPWYINYSNVAAYNYSRIDSSSKKGGISICWDSVKVFDNLPVVLFIHTNIKNLYVDKLTKVSEFVIVLDNAYRSAVINRFQVYTKCDDCFLKTKTYYSWKFDGCIVRMVFKTKKKNTFEIHVQNL